ncbi:MAG: hypothetical protein RMN53_12195 [Anaerolineae bacterium]|nr:hypothetical protein [Anaerolineae bacterium]
MDWHDLPPEAEDELLDRTIRRALQRSLGSVQPPPHVWPRLRRQIAGGPARRPRQPVVSASPFAPLVQSLAALCLLLLLGAGLRSWDSTYPLHALQRRALAVDRSLVSPAGAVRPSAQSWDDLQGARPGGSGGVNRLPAHPAPQRPAAHAPRLAALDSRDDLVSLRDVAVIPSSPPAAGRAPALPEVNPEERLQPE